MRRFLILLVSLILVSTGVESAEFEWVDFKTGLEKAAGTKRLIVVDVYTDWCGWCTKLDKEVYSQEDIRDYLGEKFVAVKLNAEDKTTRITYSGMDLNYAELAAAYGVRSYPTTLFLMPDGTLLYGLRGFHPAERFLEALRYFGDGAYLKDLEKDKGE